MTTQQVNIRLDSVTLSLLDMMVDKLKTEGYNTNRTDIIQKAIYSYAHDRALGSEIVMDVIDTYYRLPKYE